MVDVLVNCYMPLINKRSSVQYIGFLLIGQELVLVTILNFISVRIQHNTRGTFSSSVQHTTPACSSVSKLYSHLSSNEVIRSSHKKINPF